MLARNKRIRAGELQTLLKDPLEIRTKAFVLRYQENHLSHHRYSVVIGKKLLASAVARNRLRRQIQSLIQELDPLRKDSPKDNVLYPRSVCISQDQNELRHCLSPLFQSL